MKKGLVLVLAVGVAGSAWAQGTAAPQKSGKAQPGVADPAPVAPAQKEQEVQADVLLTKQQQTVLLGELNDTLKFVSVDTKLAIKKPVKGVFISRAAVATELRKKFDEDEGAKRMERSELVLKKFGLLDRDFHLRPFLLSLLTEQIAGYYDVKTKMMNLLDWVPEDQQLPVMAHELTHALQDQRVDLAKWGDLEVKGVAQNVSEDNRHIQVDESDTAREAVTEGEAMLTFGDYALKGTGKTMKDVPEMAERIQAGASDMTGSPVMARAPLLLQQALLFPYTDGLGFEEALLVQGGVDRAFAGALDRPPTSTFEVLHPDQYMAHVAVPVMRMPDVHPLMNAAGYVPYDVGVMGELDVRITAELFGGEPIAEAVAPAWAGGIYFAAQKKAAADKTSTASLGLIYASRWKNAESARTFFGVYDGQIGRKYNGVKRRQKDERDGGERVYSTNEGDVFLRLENNGVFISEGFDLEMARKLQESVDSSQGSGPMMQAAVAPPTPELTGGLVSWIGQFGMMKVALSK